MLRCKILGHASELLINLNTNKITLKCINCGEDQSDLLDLVEYEGSSITIPNTQFTIFRPMNS